MNFFRHYLRRIPPFYWLAALLLLSVAVWSAAGDTLLAKRGGDGQIDYLPSRVFSAQAFRSGALPLWNPHIFSGMSHLAIVQTAPFYPPNIVLYGALPSTVAYNLSMMLHVLLLLGFSYAYFRLLTDRAAAAWLGAVAFTFNGFLLLHIEAIGIHNSAAWIPALFYCAEKWIRSRNWKYCALGGVCLALQLLAGWPQTVLLSAIYIGIYLLTALPGERRRLNLMAGIVAMGVIAAGLSAVEVLPTMEFKQFSNLAVLTYGHFVSNSVAPQTLVTLLFPYLMGADYVTLHPVAFFGAAQMVVTATYMGILPLMLAVASLAFWRRSRYVRFGGCSAVVAAVLSCAGFTPLGPLLYRLPVYNFFRDHRVNVIFLAFCVATLAAYGAGNLGELTPQRRARLARAIPFGFLIVAAIVLIKIRAVLGSVDPHIAPFDPNWVWRLHQSMRFSNRDMMIAWLTLLAAGALLWNWMSRPGSKLIARLAIAFVLADLLWFGLSDQPHFSRGHAGPAEKATYAMVKSVANGEPFRTMSLVPDAEFIKPNLNEIAGVDDLFGYSALVPNQYADLLPVSVFELPHWRELMANNVILSLLDARFIFVRRDDAKAMDKIFLTSPHSSPEAQAATGQSQNILSPGNWVALRAGQSLRADNAFQCSDPPCGMQQPGLTLLPHSIYELRFTVAAGSRVSDLNAIIAPHNWWKPLQSFTVSNVLLSPRATPYVNIYVTGDRDHDHDQEKDELVDLRFSTDDPADVRVSDVSLARVGDVASLPENYRRIADHEGIVVVENLQALPRAFFVPLVTGVADYQRARNRLWDPVTRFQPRQEAVVEGAATTTGLGSGLVDNISYSPSRVDLDVSCVGYCYLVLADLYFPGWQAEIDGAATQIYRTDAVVRGIFVPQGQHHVQFRYRSRAVWFGLWTMLLTSLVALAMICQWPIGSASGRGSGHAVDKVG